MFQIKALSIKTVWDMTRFKTNPLQSAANHKSAQGLVIIAKRWSQISGIIFFVTISYIILTIDVQITVNVYQKRHSLLHLSQIHAPLGTIHKRRWQLFRIFDTPLPRCWQFFSTIHLQFWPIFGYQEGLLETGPYIFLYSSEITWE